MTQNETQQRSVEVEEEEEEEEVSGWTLRDDVKWGFD